MNDFVSLDVGERGRDWVRDRVTDGLGLARRLQSLVGAGDVTAWVPAGLSYEDATDFASGFWITLRPRHITDDGWERVDQSGEEAAARWLFETMRRSDLVAIAEDPLGFVSHPRAPAGSEMGVAGDDVYYILAEKTFAACLALVSEPPAYQSVCVVSAAPRPRDSRNITDAELDAIAAGTTFLVVGAYDGEGAVLWSRRSPARSPSVSTR